MTKENSLRPILPMILIFILISSYCTIGQTQLAKRGIDHEVLIIGNILAFVVCLLAFVICRRSFRSPNPQAFVRAMYGSFLIKFFVLAIAAFIYIMVTKKNVNKPALFISMGLYVIYTIMEIGALLKLMKQKKNG